MLFDTVGFEVHKDAIGVEVQYPVMQELVVELIEHQLVIGIVKLNGIELVGWQQNDAKTDGLSKEQVDQIEIKSQPGWAYPLPFELAMHSMPLANILDFIFDF